MMRSLSSRRGFLISAALLGATTLSPPWLCLQRAYAASSPPRPVSFSGGNYTYLTQPEVRFLEAACERIVPSDALGPGAKEANVVFFIDQQLSGGYGRAERWYMRAPFVKAPPNFGYQLGDSPAALYRKAIRGADDYCRKTFDGKSFAELAAADQDKILSAFEKGDAQIGDVPAKTFFDVLRQNTIEGFLSDPLYGGNKDFAGWKLIGFPGPRYNYVDHIERFGERYPLPFVSLEGRDPAGWEQ